MAIPDTSSGTLYIDGKWRHGASGLIFPVTNPATSEVLAQISAAQTQDVRDAVAAAQAAFPAWAARTAYERAGYLYEAHRLMLERAEDLAKIMTTEQGKPLRTARIEVRYAADFLIWFAEEAKRVYGQTIPSARADQRFMVLHQPVGVVGAVTPWNYPISMLTRKIGPALAAGCTVVLKPAKETPLTALAVAGILAEAGVPDGVVNVLPTRKPGPLTDAVLADPRVRKLSFTGSTEVGRMLLKQAADYVLNCSMELGGNAPFLVFDDADVDAAVDGAFLAKMRNGGEACTAANRFYVHEKVANEFSAKLSARLAALSVGPGLDDGVDLGPLVNADTRSKVADLVESATSAGANVLTGGHSPDRVGYYYEPTVLDDVPASAGILGEEIFGPVAPIVRFTDPDEAVALANNTEYGLVSYLYSGDLRRALRVAESLEAGMVGINRGVVSDPAAPFGGVKQSGLGREGAHEGLLEYTETKYIAVDW
jgi:succinate-semialdehyde dehydrogenase / glutarate-semialdehyde dehydrogenase